MAVAFEEELQILYVDSEAEFAEATAANLERDNSQFEVQVTHNSGDGLDILAECDIDCVLSDYALPGQNGVAFLERFERTIHTSHSSCSPVRAVRKPPVRQFRQVPPTTSGKNTAPNSPSYSPTESPTP